MPTASTNPAMSPPRIPCFGRSRPREAREKRGLARRQCQAAGFTETASTLTSTTPAFGAGFSVSASRSVSGGPYLSHMNAFMTGAPVRGFADRTPDPSAHAAPQQPPLADADDLAILGVGNLDRVVADSRRIPRLPSAMVG